MTTHESEDVGSWKAFSSASAPEVAKFFQQVPPGDAPTTNPSLVSTSESALRCPRIRWDLVSTGNPALRVPGRCDVWTCRYCGPKKARELVHVLAWAVPQRILTLTLAHGSIQKSRKKVTKFLTSLRQLGYAMHLAWVIEPNASPLHHIHAVQHGDFVPQRVLQRHWGARTYVEAVDGPERAVRYMLKGALGSVDGLRSHLELNGGRAIHASSGYLRGETQDGIRRRLRANRNQADTTSRWVRVRDGVEPPSPESTSGSVR